MTAPARVVHLLNDTAFGGVARALELYDHPRLAALARHRVEAVRTARRLARAFDADFILTHFPPNWACLPYLASLRLLNPRARIIHVAHSYTRNWERLKVAQRSRFRRMLRLAFGLADGVVSVSESQAAWLNEAAGLGEGRLRVIQPWSGVRRLEALEPVAERGAGPLILAAYGRFDEAKGFEVLIEAMKRLDPKQFQLRLGGFGPLEEDLKRRAGGAPNIAFLGRIDHPASLLADCHAVVVPSRWESYGLVATEAKLAARPVLTSGVDGLAEQVRDCGVITAMDDPEVLAQAIRDFSAAPLKELGLAGRADAVMLESDRLRRWIELFQNG
jgi:glycosyltransferase involved in cell wall biosynthesis